MHIAMITTSYPRFQGDPGGHFVARLAEGLVGVGHRVTVVAPHTAEAAPIEVLNGLTVRRFSYAPEPWERVAYGPGVLSNVRGNPRAAIVLPAFVLAMRRAARWVAEYADVVHVHWAQNATLASLRRFGPPVVVTLHGSDVALAGTPGLGWSVRRAMREADAVVAVSEDLARRVSPYLPKNRGVDIVPCGVETSLLETPPAYHPVGDGPVQLLYVGRLIREKGIAELVDALGRVSAPFELTVVGDGPMRAEFEAGAARAGAARAVRFLGGLSHDEVLDRMRAADLVVVPSHNEGCGLVPIEAAAVGTAVVVTRTGAMPAVACERAVVEPKDVAGLAAAIDLLAADPRLRAEAAEAARARVAERFTWERAVDSMEGVYRRVAAGSGADAVREVPA